MKKRKDCFFGLHFDFHANVGTVGIGREFEPEQLDKFLKEIKPDFVQCDTKGHAGYASYPTKVGRCPRGIKKDILHEWRRITEENGISLYGHHSGVWDAVAVKEHPEWGVLDKDGNPDELATSLFGDYADERLIPQLIELAKDYKLNGVWIDGDGWGATPDYSEAAQKAWGEKTGKAVPKPEDSDWRAYLDFCRQAFLDYVRHYTEEVKKTAPDFEVCSNWLNTTYVPVDDEITDFISGDMATVECADSARFDGRFIADYHRPWDLMAWGFQQKNRNLKTAEQLCQELALVLSLGGGVQVYYNQSPYQMIGRYPAVLATAKKISEFCRSREACSKGLEILPTIGVVFSAEAFYKDKCRIFADWEDMIYTRGVRGIMNNLLDNQVPTEILRASQLANRDLSAYSMIFLSDCPDMESDLPENLLAYAQNGGTIVLSGVDTLKAFADQLGYSCVDVPDDHTVMAMCADGFGTITGPFTQLEGAVKPLCNAMIETPDKYVDTNGASLYEMSWGKGKVYLVPFNLGFTYFDYPNYTLRSLMGKMLDATRLPLRGYGSQKVTISLGQKNGKHLIHLVNMNGEGRSPRQECFEEITPIHNFRVDYSVEKKPVLVRNLPDGQELPFDYADGKLTVTLPKLDIHCCIEISF